MSDTTTATTTPKKKLPISANQVTVVRILALPFPCYALLARPEPWIMWVAFVFGAIVGATDFVDGWMARRDGPTTLGGLLDPVADKLFIAMLLLPLVARGECPGWAAGALFVRELMITSLRSSMALRKQALKTSSLGKLKTVVQMGGIAVFFFTVFVPPPALVEVLLAWALFFGALGVFWIVGRKRTLPLWLGATPVLLVSIAVVAVLRSGATGSVLDADAAGAKDASAYVFLVMVLLTWVSGADYLTGSWRAFRATGGVRFADVVRVLWSLVHGLALIPLLDNVFDPTAPLRGLAVPVIVSLSAELTLGGVENLVTAERGRWARGSVLPTMLAAAAVGVCAWQKWLAPSTLELAAWGLALFSVANLAVAFWLDRDVFLAPNRPLAP